MEYPKIVTLTTDFGYSDGYVGAVKGVLLSEVETITVVDIAHAVPPQNVIAAMIALQAAARSTVGRLRLIDSQTLLGAWNHFT